MIRDSKSPLIPAQAGTQVFLLAAPAPWRRRIGPRETRKTRKLRIERGGATKRAASVFSVAKETWVPACAGMSGWWGCTARWSGGG
jgi:hypothetical protein